MPCLSALLCPPLPRRYAVMRVHATVGGAGLFLLADIVDAEPGGRPSEPLANHDGSWILAGRSAYGDDPPVPVAVLLLADDRSTAVIACSLVVARLPAGQGKPVSLPARRYPSLSMSPSVMVWPDFSAQIYRLGGESRKAPAA
jgi:hypothetical protein